ncbi:MAG: hypothetical protein PHD67_04170 [Oscillospiraceae bacterium]|nr:hypothetical protein [Oscillospiraceae bacterium]
MEEKKDFYIVVTQTGTILSRIVKLFTGRPYSHCSVSFDGGLTDMRSFGRLIPRNPFVAGYVHENRLAGVFLVFYKTRCRVYHARVSPEQYARARAVAAVFDRDPAAYKFNYIGIVCNAFGIAFHSGNRYFCSQFVAKVLHESGIHRTDKDYSLARPYDFYDMDGFELIYEGLLREYDPAAGRAV